MTSIDTFSTTIPLPPLLKTHPQLSILIKSLYIHGTFTHALLQASSFQDLLPFLSNLSLPWIQTTIQSTLSSLPTSDPSFQRLNLIYIECLLSQQLFPEACEAIKKLQGNANLLKVDHQTHRLLICSAACLRGLYRLDDSLKCLNKLFQFYNLIDHTKGKEMAEVYYQMALTYKSMGKLSQSYENLEKSLEIHQSNHLDEINLIITSGIIQREIALVCSLQAQPQKAWSFLQKSLEKLQGYLLKTHPEVGHTLRVMAEISFQLGRDQDGYEYSEAAFDIISKTYDNASPFLADAYCTLGKAYARTGKTQLAQNCYQSGLSLAKALRSKGNLQLRTLANLQFGQAELNQEKLNYKEALKIYQDCLGTMGTWLGAQRESYVPTAEVYIAIAKVHIKEMNLPLALEALHQASAILYNAKIEGTYINGLLQLNLGHFYLLRGNLRQASQSMQQSVRNLRKEVSEDSYHIAQAYQLEGMVLEALGRVFDSQQSYIKGLMLVKRVYGPESYHLWELYYLIGTVYIRQGKLRDAIESLRNSMQRVSKFYGNQDQRLVKVYLTLGDVYLEQKKIHLAAKTYKMGLAILTQAEEDRAVVCMKHEYLARLALCKDDSEKALEIFGQALEAKKRYQSLEHPELAEIYIRMAKIYQEKECYEKTLEKLHRAQKILEQAFGVDHINLYTLYHCLGNVFLEKGMPKKAFENYNKAIVLVKKSFGTKNPALGDIYKDLGTLCNLQGRYESAQVYLEMAAHMHQTAWNKEHEKVFRSCLSLGSLYGMAGRFELGIAYLKEANVALKEAQVTEKNSGQQIVEQKLKAFKTFSVLQQSLSR